MNFLNKKTVLFDVTQCSLVDFYRRSSENVGLRENMKSNKITCAFVCYLAVFACDLTYSFDPEESKQIYSKPGKHLSAYAASTHIHRCENLRSNTAVLYMEVTLNLKMEAVRSSETLVPVYTASQPRRQSHLTVTAVRPWIVP
jgi:hypothetical protein